MSRSLDLPASAHLWTPATAPTVVFSGPSADLSCQAQLQQQGVEVVILPELRPNTVMQALYERGCAAVLWECGGTLAASAIRDRAVQKVWAFVAPKLIGGVNAPSPIGDLGLQRMTEALVLERLQWRCLGPDLLIQGYLAQEPLGQTS